MGKYCEGKGAQKPWVTSKMIANMDKMKKYILKATEKVKNYIRDLIMN